MMGRKKIIKSICWEKQHIDMITNKTNSPFLKKNFCIIFHFWLQLLQYYSVVIIHRIHDFREVANVAAYLWQ